MDGFVKAIQEHALTWDAGAVVLLARNEWYSDYTDLTDFTDDCSYIEYSWRGCYRRDSSPNEWTTITGITRIKTDCSSRRDNSRQW